MKKLILNTMLTAGMAFSMSASTALAAPVQITVMCNKGLWCSEAIGMAMKEFEKKNPDIKIKMENVSYGVIKSALPTRLAAGEGPDISAIADKRGLQKYLLDIAPYVDVARWERDYGPYLPPYRKDGDMKNGIYGLQIEAAVTGAWVNKTLFDQAGIAMPKKGATWQDWATAVRKVAKATGTKGMAFDRSGHRIGGAAVSYGAKMVDSQGRAMLVDEGYKNFVTDFVKWHKDGTMLKGVWMGTGGGKYQNAWKEFYAGNLVFNYAGSWGIGLLTKNVGNKFDWVTIPEPCGVAACTPMPAGMGVVGFKHTKHPKEVARVLDYISQPDVYEKIALHSTTLSTNKTVRERIKYQNTTPKVDEALKVFSAKLGEISPVARAYQSHNNAAAMHNISATRISQTLIGEIDVDGAMKLIKEDIVKLNNK